MAITLIATPGASDANSYADLQFANDYFEGILYATYWNASDDNVKKAALIWSTRTFDTIIEWNAFPYTTTQSLLLPQSGLIHASGVEVAVDEIPVLVKGAVCELANLYIEKNLLKDPSSNGIKSVKAGSVAVEFDNTFTPDILPDQIFNMVKQYGKKNYRSNTVSLMRC